MVLMKFFYCERAQNGDNYLHMNEIELYANINGVDVNVARFGTATSKSVYTWITQYYPSYAIDGITNTTFDDGTIFHSNNGSNEWIQIELDKIYDIKKIRIYNEYGDYRNPTMQYRIGNAIMAGYIDPNGKTNSSLRVWSGVFDPIPQGYNNTLKRYWDYDIAEEIPCYNKGTTILCLIDNIEKYVKIENLKVGDLVKTYKNGYNEIELIGKKTFRNNINKNTQCMFNINNLCVSGGHYILVDEKPDATKNPIFYNLNLKIKDKYCLLACDYEKAIKVMTDDIYTIYHLVLKGDEMQYGIYVNDGFLSESTSKEHFILSKFNEINI